LDLVKDESERIDSRFLEPACGTGNFLVPVLRRKLESVNRVYGKNEFERLHYGLLALMCVYGIELLRDNILECRKNLLDEFMTFAGAESEMVWYQAASRVIAINIVHGDAQIMKDNDGDELCFSEWGYLTKGRFQRRDFKLETLALRSSLGEGLFSDLDEKALNMQENLRQIREYPPMTVEEIAQ
jgi:hypothetical protein